MPQIPVFSGRQILEPSNPVAPIAEAETAGALLGRAEQGFGQAMFALGNELDKAAKKAKEEKDKNGAMAVVIASKDWYELERATKANAPADPNDPDGKKLLVDVKQRGDEFTRDLMKKYNLSRNMQASVWQQILPYRNERTTMMYADLVEKNEKTGMALEQENINSIFAQARSGTIDPGEAVVSIQEIYKNSRYIQDADKILKARTATDILGQELVSGITDRMWKAKTSEEARALAEAGKEMISKNIAGFLSSEKITAETNRLEEQFSKVDNYLYGLNRRARTAKTELITDTDNAASAQVTQALVAAGTDQAKISAAMGMAAEFVQKGDLLPETFSHISEARFDIPREKSQAYETTFHRQMLTKFKTNFNGAKAELDDALKNRKIDASVYNRLIKDVNDLRENLRKDPALGTLIAKQVDVAEKQALLQYDLYDTNPNTVAERNTVAAKAGLKVLENIYGTGAQSNVGAIAREADKARSSEGTAPSFTTVTGMTARDMEQPGYLEGKRKEMLGRAAIEKDPQKKKELLLNIKKVDQNIRIMNQRQGQRTGTPAQNTPSPGSRF